MTREPKYEIEIRGTAGTNGTPSMLHGTECQENFADYLTDESFASKIKSGYMSFFSEGDKLYTVTLYIANEPLTDLELEELESYTVGQWSDGIGEGYEQEPIAYEDGEEIYISPYTYNQIITVTQKEVQ